MPRAAVSISIASTRVRPSSARRSLRPAAQPIETWSSCIALLGMLSTLAGTARRLSSETIAACVYWAIIRPGVDAGVVGQERRQAVVAVLVQEAVGAALGHAREVGGGDRQEVEHVAERGAVEVAVGLDAAVERDHGVVDRGLRARGRRRARRGPRCRGRRRRPAARSAASTRPARAGPPGRGGWRRSGCPSSSARMLRAETAWPCCGRSCCRSSANTRSVPSRPSTLIAAAMSAATNSVAQVVRAPGSACRASRRCR